MDKLKMHSPNLTQDNIARIRELFPGCVTEARGEDGRVKLAVDFDQLRQELSDSIVDGPQERYHLNWPGKREALLTANAPIAKTLRPCRDESVDFDTTKNLFIEGDNLDALKLLQETYLGKVKMIYIDPPYNTGNDFIYEDDFAEGAKEYLRRSNQKDEQGNRLVANSAANGRFHSDWLTMMYPRMKLARYLLKDEGAIFISIGDDEITNLRKLCDEIFGEDNFVGTFVWKRRVSSGLAEKLVSTDHEYVVVYQKQNFTYIGLPKSFSNYSNPDNDPRGDWIADNLTVGMNKDLRPNQFYSLVDPKTGKSYPPNPNRVWAYIPSSMDKLIADGRILFPEDTSRRPMLKRFKSELKTDVNPVSTWLTDVGLNTEATRELQEIFDQSPFDYSKPISLLNHLLKTTTRADDLVLDFFAGSGTTAHALLALNAIDGGQRRFIAVQLPEVTTRGLYKTIAEVCKERIRRAGRKILEGECHENWNKDVGFRTLKIDTSNMADVYYAPDALDKANLDLFVDNIKPDRTPEDLLFQVMLDWGVDLSLPIGRERVKSENGKVRFEPCDPSDFTLHSSPFTLYTVDGNALAACFDAHGNIDEAFVKELAKRQPLRVVFRDAGFKDDATKINVEQIFKLLSPATEVKRI